MKSSFGECSINILNYNTYNKTKVCIESCLKQIGVDFTIIVIDNKSTDDSLAKLKGEYLEKIVFLENEENYGFARGNNIGVRFASAHGVKYSLLLNSDTELVSEKILVNLVEIIKSNSRCAVVAPTIYNVTSKGLQLLNNDSKYLALLRKFHILPQLRRVSENIDTISEAHGSALMIKNSIFEEVGGFPEHYFMYCEESTFAKKIIWGGYDIFWFKSDTQYILHHHDKTGKVDKWRLYLMGRNRYLEYNDYKKYAPFKWKVVFEIIILKRIIDGDKAIIQGIIDGRKLIKTGKSKDEIFSLGREAIERIGS